VNSRLRPDLRLLVVAEQDVDRYPSQFVVGEGDGGQGEFGPGRERVVAQGSAPAGEDR
jgi:hypothetical protein